MSRISYKNPVIKRLKLSLCASLVKCEANFRRSSKAFNLGDFKSRCHNSLSTFIASSLENAHDDSSSISEKRSPFATFLSVAWTCFFPRLPLALVRPAKVFLFLSDFQPFPERSLVSLSLPSDSLSE